MNLDDIIYYVVLPFLRYPFVPLLPFTRVSVWTKFIAVLFSIALHLFLHYNRWWKTNRMGNWTNPILAKGNIIVISGGSGGLGQALITTVLGKFPLSTIVNIDIVPSEVSNERIKFYHCDLSKPEEVDRVLALIEDQFAGRIGCIINNAGIRLPFNKMRTLPEQEIKKIFQINCFSGVKLIQTLTPKKSEDRHCYVVTIASILGVLNASKVSAYAASKAALISFHQSFEHELISEKESHIRTLLVLPGQLNTKMFGGFEPPRQFWAPTVDTTDLAEEIIQKYSTGECGTLYKPFYAYFSHLLMSLPYCIQVLTRRVSRIDDCLPDESQ